MAKILNFRVIIEQDEDKVFVASVPSIPGCHTQGDSYEEVLANVQEAIQLCLEVAKKDKSYKDKIDWSETSKDKTRFLGVAEVSVPFT